MTDWQRPDGRSRAELRPVSFQRQFTKFAAGSVLVKFGDTHVLCTASISEEVPKFLAGSGQGWLTAEYQLLPGSTSQRHPREIARISGRTAEIQRLIGRSLRSVLNLTELGSRTITIDTDVLQADGGTRTAAITGGYVALQDALQWLLAQNLVPMLPQLQPIAAISVGIVQETAVLDLCYAEDSQATVDMNVVMTDQGDYVEIQGAAEQKPFTPAQLQELLSLASHGIEQLLELQRLALKP